MTVTEASHAAGEFVKAAGGLLWRHSGVELQVAVIHRPQKSDWTLPKGKLEEGESWREAALREVREETQCEVSLGQFIGSSRYISRGRPKVVLYWHMDLGTERPFTANREVDRLVWLTCEQALQRLMYTNEKALLKRAYYVARSPGIEEGFEEAARAWSNVLSQQFGVQMAQSAVSAARQALKELIPRLPYIGGNDNHLTDTLIDSARCLALYVALKSCGKTAEQTGKVLYDAERSRFDEPDAMVPSSQPLTEVELMARRRQRAARSLLRQYEEDWVYEFVQGDGQAFDYGYDFHECAVRKFYRAHGADEFLPFYCFLDFVESRRCGLGLQRTVTLAEGHAMCDHRFKRGRNTEPTWPPSLRDRVPG